MASDLAWQEGYYTAQNQNAEARQKKNAADQAYISDLLNQRAQQTAKLGNLTDSNGNPMPGYDEVMNDHANTIKAINEFYHPDKNPGAIAKFGYMLTDAMRLTNPQDRVKQEAAKRATASFNAEQQAQADARALPQNAAQTAKEQDAIKQQQFLSDLNFKINSFQNSDIGRNATPQQKEEFMNSLIESAYGFKPEPRGNWVSETRLVPNDPKDPSKGTHPITYSYNHAKGTYANPVNNGEDIDPDDLQVFLSSPLAPKVSSGKMSNIDEQRESFRIGHGIPSGTPLTWQQEQQFMSELYKSRNPLALAHLSIAQQNLALRENEDAFKDYLTAQKQLSPLERMIDTANETQQYVSQPTGPGDVALTLAFFDAIKTSGVRFTKQEQDFITGSRGFMDGVQAKFDQGFKGTVFAPEQRAIIAGIVQKAAQEAGTQHTGILGAATAFKPNVARQLTGGGTAPKPAAGGNAWDSLPDVVPVTPKKH